MVDYSHGWIDGSLKMWIWCGVVWNCGRFVDP